MRTLLKNTFRKSSNLFRLVEYVELFIQVYVKFSIQCTIASEINVTFNVFRKLQLTAALRNDIWSQ